MACKTGYIGLAFLMLISTSGLMLNRHFCQDELKSIAFFTRPQPCHMPKETRSCPVHANMTIQIKDTQKNCCDDKSELLKVKSPQILYFSGLHLALPSVIGIASPLFSKTFQHYIQLPQVHYLNYKPPLIVCNLIMLLQTFLC